jgi:hypothetical protein
LIFAGQEAETRFGRFIMRRRFALAVLIIAVQAGCFVPGAQAQDQDINCDSFLKNPDGSWTVIEKVFIPVQNVRVREGTVFRPGQTFLGDDMTIRLSKACPNKAVTAAPDEAQQPQGPQGPSGPQPQVPYVPLSKYADANGNIDVQRLSCAHLDQASPAETELLLAWYSGRYNGGAKARGINLARLRYAMRNVVNYCNANPDKGLAQVMELMLK